MNSDLVAIIALVFFLLHFVLLARCSHWAHATQAKLDETNKLLKQFADRDARS